MLTVDAHLWFKWRAHHIGTTGVWDSDPGVAALAGVWGSDPPAALAGSDSVAALAGVWGSDAMVPLAGVVGRAASGASAFCFFLFGGICRVST